MAAISFFCVNILVAQSQNNSPSSEFIKYSKNVNDPLTAKELGFIEEVYQDKAEQEVLQNAQVLKDIKHLLRNRILIYKVDDDSKHKKCQLLSEVPLFNDFNSGLKRDTIFNLDTFNPLKYKLKFFGKGTYLYRIDNTNYYIQVTSQYRQ